MPLNIKGLYVKNYTEHDNALYYVECRYVERHILFFMLSVIILNVIMPGVIILNVIRLSVVTPILQPRKLVRFVKVSRNILQWQTH
jgi:hypothetical protein